jgi:hypothetical protein
MQNTPFKVSGIGLWLESVAVAALITFGVYICLWLGGLMAQERLNGLEIQVNTIAAEAAGRYEVCTQIVNGLISQDKFFIIEMPEVKQ